MTTFTKTLALAATLGVAASATFAGGLAEPVMEMAPVVVMEETAGSSSSAGILIPLILIALIAAAMSSSSGGGADLEPL
ncbi:hypothetical protein [Pseudooctadecabacter jejudonensis]|uniref:Ferrochelatase n=1 Tax=Pseudooctadecabacter jejudonensis TaxID=1391910 RepID=A0A1Y5RFJ2_9RHOB|nr:hypothetical protein [Pseudooctadecabacter jejudonensis]SLN16385.1 hypothetical protein PSJ8397_00417 [Pseudooctadecabacter jejudonensis]